MIGRETLIALRARRTAHRVATDFLLPQLHLPQRPLVIRYDEQPDEFGLPLSEPISRSPTWVWAIAYMILIVVFVSLVCIVAFVLQSLLIK